MSFITKNMYFLVTVKSNENNQMIGELHSPVLKESIEFHGLTHLLLIMDRIMQDCDIPKYDERYRSFTSQNKIQMDIAYQRLNQENFQKYIETSMNYPKKSLNNFQIKVMYRQHNTWQGEIDWIEENKARFFRSALELMEMIYFAL